jgi:hypothetical protein
MDVDHAPGLFEERERDRPVISAGVSVTRVNRAATAMKVKATPGTLKP